MTQKVIVIAEFHDENFVLVGVYGYNKRTKNKELIDELCKQIWDCGNAYSTDNIIVGGDYNLAPHLWMDGNPLRASATSMMALL